MKKRSKDRNETVKEKGGRRTEWACNDEKKERRRSKREGRGRWARLEKK